MVQPKAGWLPVRTATGVAGWVGDIHVRDLSIVAAETATRIISGPVGAPFDAIDPAWFKPGVRPSDISVQGGKLKCGAVGDGGDTATTRRKNRADSPDSSYLITLDAIRALNDTNLWTKGDRTNWKAPERALVDPFEGTAVTVEGFFEIVDELSAARGIVQGEQIVDGLYRFVFVAGDDGVSEPRHIRIRVVQRSPDERDGVLVNVVPIEYLERVEDRSPDGRGRVVRRLEDAP